MDNFHHTDSKGDNSGLLQYPMENLLVVLLQESEQQVRVERIPVVLLQESEQRVRVGAVRDLNISK